MGFNSGFKGLKQRDKGREFQREWATAGEYTKMELKKKVSEER